VVKTHTRNRKELKHKQEVYFRWGLVLLVALTAMGLYQLRSVIHANGWYDLYAKFRTAEVFGWVGLVFFVLGMVVLMTRFTESFLNVATKKINSPTWLRWAAGVGTALLAAVYPMLMFGEFKRYFFLDWTRQATFVWLAILASLFLAVLLRKSWVGMMPLSAALLAVAYHLVTYFPDVSNYPFALGWSETTRYYLASTFFDKRIYGMDLPMVFRDFTRYLMQAVPFLIEDSPLWLHRVWQVVLRFTSTYLAGYVVARRYKVQGARWIALFSMWAGMYFFQGPVFYNLMVNVILVYWLVKPDRFWRGLVPVAGISVWAGLSRVNWIPMPGLMAAAFCLMETPLEGRDFKSVARYLMKPAIWVVAGIAVGLAVQQGYAMISGNPEEIYYASFSSYLLWYRLLPNLTYSMGILPSVLLLTIPLLVFIGIAWAAWDKRWHFIRPLGLSVILLGLFFGGLLVSVKIGGGTNLHNMDVYLVILLLLAGEIFFGVGKDDAGKPLKVQMPEWLLAVIFAIPIIFVISYGGGGFPERDMDYAEGQLAQLQAYIDQAEKNGGDILFISQRHLITFGLVDNVTLVHAHEKLLLQEMAMSQNQAYLDALGLELAEQRYALIIHDPLPSEYRNADQAPLAAENNVVLKEITPLFTCAYQEVNRLLDDGLSILAPAPFVTCDQAEE
jgi:hypothetical protein